ncbi:MAG: HlyD family type I secretion periplasmic adaptor subunit [Nitratireductor sp.]|nr:HlyD family type I secretion periplasmic adaptor subunit [Nitratireductor sp.]
MVQLKAAKTSKSVQAARPRSDCAFLPAALEILETPASPVRIAFLWTICLLASSALLWAYLGKIDIVATAQGKVQPAGRVKTIQSLESGRVSSAIAINGAPVKKGDTLLRLDAGEAQSDETALIGNLTSLEGEIARRKAVLQAIRSWRLHSDRREEAGTVPDLQFPPSVPPSIRQRERQSYRAELDELEAGLNVLRAQSEQKHAEIRRLKRSASSQSALIETLSERVAMRSSLFQAKVETKAHLLETLQALQEAEVGLATLKGQCEEAKAALKAIENEADKLVKSYVNDNDKRQSEALQRAAELKQTLLKAERRRALMTIVSPIDGTVEASAITTVGQVVTAGTELMRVVPEGARLEVEAYLANRDVGFVEVGQEAIIKIEAFPFTRHGTLTGRVTHVATDAIPEPDAREIENSPAAELKSLVPLGNVQRMQNLVFPITVELMETTFMIEDRLAPLMPGMIATVEIKTGQRRILEYLFSPLAEIGDQSFKER